MATAWSALGSRVTLLARGRLLDRLPEFVGALVAAGLRDAGVDVRLGADVAGAERAADGTVTVRLDDGTTVEADEVLAATGRAPHTGDIGLETIGLQAGSWLEVDETLRVRGVDGDWLYACGDANHLALLTHMGKYQGRICGDAIAVRARGAEPAVTDWASTRCVPQVIFTVPEVAAAGLSAPEAERDGRRVPVGDYQIGNVARAGLYPPHYPAPPQVALAA